MFVANCIGSSETKKAWTKSLFSQTFLRLCLLIADRESSSTNISKKRHILRRVMSQGTGEKSLKSDPKVMMVSKWYMIYGYYFGII